MSSPGPSPQNILLVDDDPDVIQAMSRALAGIARMRFATSGLDALRLAREEAPDLLMLDAEMPGMNGFEVLEALRREPSLVDLPVIFVTSHAEEAMEEAGLALGAADFIAKPLRPAIVAARVKTQLRLKLLTDRLRRLAGRDGLTRVANRRTFDKAIASEWSQALREPRPLSILLIDVDHFRLYNERHGDLQGDDCLAAFAQVLSGCARPSGDLVARYGGDKFVVLLPATAGDAAQKLANDILSRIEQAGLPHEASPRSVLTVSIGIATFDASSTGFESRATGLTPGEPGPSELSVGDVMAAADRALVAAKQSGRARAEFARIELRPAH